MCKCHMGHENVKIKPKETDTLIDTLLFTSLFYVLSNPSVHALSNKYITFIKDRQALHAIVFAISYVIIQKLTKRV
jgi:hypothetical protein